ncbi:MAG: hypothetical protein ABMA14_15155 [Hyphomonadaceae bacterium]
MRDYSFRFLDQLGRSQPGEHARFMDDAAAADFARGALSRSYSVEVWRGKECVIRVERPFSQPVVAPTAITIPVVNATPEKSAAPHIIAIHGYDRPTK